MQPFLKRLCTLLLLSLLTLAVVAQPGLQKTLPKHINFIFPEPIVPTCGQVHLMQAGHQMERLL